jgi:glycosyltransferase involved in cell wall biosynthesis
MSNRKSVSIIIPTFNRAHYLLQTIESCINQTYPCEVIVCDHGSSDETVEVMKRFSDKVRYLRRDEDFGPHFCWLDGVLHAAGEYIHLQYDDDWIKPTYIAECMKLFNKDVGFVFSIAEIFDENQNMICREMFYDNFKKKGAGIYKRRDVESFFLNYLISPGAMIIRKQDAIDALYQGRLPINQYYYHGVGPDCFFALLCLLRYPKIGFVAEPLAVFRAHNYSITINAKKDDLKYTQLKLAYKETRDYYLLLKWARIVKIYNQFILKYWHFYIRHPKYLINKVLKVVKGVFLNGKHS